MGLRRPDHPLRVVLIGIALGVAYQFAGLYAVEPAIARLTQSGLPDVSAFRALIGDERRLVFWVGLSWTMAAFMEELVFRGWLLSRIAETGMARRTAGQWVIASSCWAKSGLQNSETYCVPNLLDNVERFVLLVIRLLHHEESALLVLGP